MFLCCLPAGSQVKLRSWANTHCRPRVDQYLLCSGLGLLSLRLPGKPGAEGGDVDTPGLWLLASCPAEPYSLIKVRNPVAVAKIQLIFRTPKSQLQFALGLRVKTHPCAQHPGLVHLASWSTWASQNLSGHTLYPSGYQRVRGDAQSFEIQPVTSMAHGRHQEPDGNGS